MGVENINFQEVDDFQLDTSNKRPTVDDVNKLLGLKGDISTKAVLDRQKSLRDDIEFKSGASRCMVFCESLEGRNLAMFDAHLKGVLLG